MKKKSIVFDRFDAAPKKSGYGSITVVNRGIADMEYRIGRFTFYHGVVTFYHEVRKEYGNPQVVGSYVCLTFVYKGLVHDRTIQAPSPYTDRALIRLAGKFGREVVRKYLPPVNYSMHYV